MPGTNDEFIFSPIYYEISKRLDRYVEKNIVDDTTLIEEFKTSCEAAVTSQEIAQIKAVNDDWNNLCGIDNGGESLKFKGMGAGDEIYINEVSNQSSVVDLHSIADDSCSGTLEFKMVIQDTPATDDPDDAPVAAEPPAPPEPETKTINYNKCFPSFDVSTPPLPDLAPILATGSDLFDSCFNTESEPPGDYNLETIPDDATKSKLGNSTEKDCILSDIKLKYEGKEISYYSDESQVEPYNQLGSLMSLQHTPGKSQF